MHLPEHHVTITIVGPWGTFPEYPHEIYEGNRRSFVIDNYDIPVYPGTPFRIAYAVSWAPTWGYPDLLGDKPLYLHLQLYVGGEIVGNPFIINQRKRGECTGFIPPPKGKDGKEIGFMFCYPWIGNKGKKPDPYLEVKVYRCKGIGKQPGPNGKVMINAKAVKLARCRWWYRDPGSLVRSVPYPAIRVKPLPLYTKGPVLKSTTVRKPLPPQLREARHVLHKLWDIRRKNGCRSPLRAVSFPEIGSKTGVTVLIRPTQQLPEHASHLLGVSNLGSGIKRHTDTQWHIHINSQGKIKYSPKHISRAIVQASLTRINPQTPYIWLPSGWEKRYIKGSTYFFDHNTKTVYHQDPHEGMLEMQLANEALNVAPLHAICLDKFRKSRSKP